jgi:hypothetical protein
LVSTSDEVIRHIPAAFAKALVDGGSAIISEGNGKIRAVRLVTTAATLQRIGPASSGSWHTQPFAVREHLDGGGVVWRHHPRSTYE